MTYLAVQLESKRQPKLRNLIKRLLTSAALATVAFMSGPALAQNTDTATDGNTAYAMHTETTAKSMQADSTKPHHAMKSGQHSSAMKNSSDANSCMADQNMVRAPRGTGDGQQRDSN